MMITLSNKAKILAAYIMPAEFGMKPHGVVLAEYREGVEWATWEVYHDGDFTMTSDSADEVWEAESGHYFGRMSDGSNPLEMAKFDYGLRLRLHMDSTILRGAKA